MIKMVKTSSGYLMYRNGKQFGIDRTGSTGLITGGKELSKEQKRCERKRGFFIVTE